MPIPTGRVNGGDTAPAIEGGTVAPTPDTTLPVPVASALLTETLPPVAPVVDGYLAAAVAAGAEGADRGIRPDPVTVVHTSGPRERVTARGAGVIRGAWPVATPLLEGAVPLISLVNEDAEAYLGPQVLPGGEDEVAEVARGELDVTPAGLHNAVLPYEVVTVILVAAVEDQGIHAHALPAAVLAMVPPVGVDAETVGEAAPHGVSAAPDAILPAGEGTLLPRLMGGGACVVRPRAV